MLEPRAGASMQPVDATETTPVVGIADEPAAVALPQPTLKEMAAGFGCLLAVTAAAWTLAVVFKLVRGNHAEPRVKPTNALWSLGLVLLVSLVVYVAAAAVIISLGSSTPADDGPAGGIGTRALVINGIVTVIGVLALLASLIAAQRALGAPALGLAPGRMGRGVLLGLAWLLVIMPTMFMANLLMVLVRQGLGFTDTPMHSLLEAMQGSESPLFLVLALTTAVTLAPLSEELVFRGLIQTLLVFTTARLILARPVDEPLAAEVVANPLAEPLKPLSYASVPTAEQQAPSVPALATWTGIVLASIPFALLHEPWSIPLIFLLAVLMGWAYERTQNLWTPITIHFGFNLFNSLMLLAGMWLQSPGGN